MLSFSVLAHVAAAIVVGPIGAALVAALGVVIVDGLRRESRNLVLLNASMFGGSIWLAAELYQLAGGSTTELAASSLPALAVLILSRYATTSFVFALGTALARGESVLLLLKEIAVEELGAALGEGSLGVLVAFGLMRGQWIMLPFLVPLLAALYSSKSTFHQLKGETSDALEAVAQLVDERDPSTAQHTRRVAEYVQRFAEAMQLPERETERLVAAARLHDLGKIAVDVATLSKKDRLSDAELRAIRRHPRLSAHLLSPFHFAQEMALYVELHHERYDGRGYYSVPRAEIPIESHVLIAADSFDAMTSERPYRPSLSAEEAAMELRDKAGTQFHPLVAPAFAAVMLGQDVRAAIGPGDLATLRRSFARFRLVPQLSFKAVLQPRALTVAFAAGALVLLGLPVPVEVPAGLAVGILGSALWWFGTAIDLSRRAARGTTAVRAGGDCAQALLDAGIPGWAAWLGRADDSDAYRLVGETSPEASANDVREACNWAMRREDKTKATLSSGTHLILTEAGLGHERLAVGLSRSPTLAEHRLVERLVRELEEKGSPSAAQGVTLKLVPSAERRRRRARVRAALMVELPAYEEVRREAGQLMANHLTDEAEARLRSLLRNTDRVVRLGDNRFGVLLFVHDVKSLERVCDRIQRELDSIPMPRKIASLKAKIVPALGEEIASLSELAGLEWRFADDVGLQAIG